MNTTCQQNRERFTDYLSQSLPPLARGRVDAHLAGCPACAAELKATWRMVSALAEVAPPQLPSGFEQRLRARLLNEADAMRAAGADRPASKGRRLRFLASPGAWVRGFAAGLVTCAVAGMALVITLERSHVTVPAHVAPAAVPAAMNAGTHLAMGGEAVVNIRFDAARAVQGVRFSITLPQGVRAVVNGELVDSASLTWTGDLKQGVNRIPLQVRGVARGEWTVTASLEKGNARKEQSLGVVVNGV